MEINIVKFDRFNEAVSNFDLNGLLNAYKIKISDLNDMIDNLKKYELNPILLNELKRSQSINWRDLRKWKLDSYLSRYESYRNAIEKLKSIEEMIEDYSTELTDMGYTLVISARYSKIKIYAKDVRKTKLERMGDVINFLLHLNRTKRLFVELNRITNLNEFIIDFNPKTPFEPVIEDRPSDNRNNGINVDVILDELEEEYEEPDELEEEYEEPDDEEPEG